MKTVERPLRPYSIHMPACFLVTTILNLDLSTNALILRSTSLAPRRSHHSGRYPELSDRVVRRPIQKHQRAAGVGKLRERRRARRSQAPRVFLGHGVAPVAVLHAAGRLVRKYQHVELRSQSARLNFRVPQPAVSKPELDRKS